MEGCIPGRRGKEAGKLWIARNGVGIELDIGVRIAEEGGNELDDVSCDIEQSEGEKGEIGRDHVSRSGCELSPHWHFFCSFWEQPRRLPLGRRLLLL